MEKYKIILASNSPRRRELLAGLDLDFQVKVIAGIAEDYPADMPAADIPLFLARQKAEPYKSIIADDELVLTADTVVIVGNEVLGKPAEDEDAKRILRKLSGRSHRVTTGVCFTTTERQHAFAVTTEVTFKSLDEEEINYYVERYHPTDKAGAYGIQEWIGYVGVTRIEGSYFNVMGLPVQRIWEELKAF